MKQKIDSIKDRIPNFKKSQFISLDSIKTACSLQQPYISINPNNILQNNIIIKQKKQKNKYMFCSYCGNEDEKQQEIHIIPQIDVKNKSSNLDTVNKSKYNQYLKKCQQEKKKFTDNQFPPNSQSLNFTLNNRNITWKRVTEIVPNAVIVGNRIDGSTVQQVNVNDCYFLGCISAIAQIPQRINKIFYNMMQISQQGIYRLQIKYKGELQQLIIDDFVPCYGSNRPVFCKPMGNQVWVMLLEKAWAKLRGSYGNIQRGYSHEVLNTFLVSPCSYYQISNSLVKSQNQRDELWTKILNAVNQNKVVCIGSRQNYACKGIRASYTYSVIGANEVRNMSNETAKILKIRNPSCDIQYNGQNSEKDEQFWSKVSQHKRSEVLKKNENAFTMSFREFLMNFISVDISCQHSDYNYVSKRAQIKSQVPEYFELVINNNVENEKTGYKNEGNENCYITIQKIFNRNLLIKAGQINYGYNKLIIAKKIVDEKQGLEYEYVNSILESNFVDVTIQLGKLPQGKYIVMAQTEFPEHGSGEITLSVYSKQRPFIKKIGCPDQYFINKVFRNHVSRIDSLVPVPRKMKIEGTANDWIIFQLLVKEGGFGYIYVRIARNSEEKIQITCNLSKIKADGFYIIEENCNNGSWNSISENMLKIMVKSNESLLLLFGVNLQENIRGISFPPKGVKIQRIL